MTVLSSSACGLIDCSVDFLLFDIQLLFCSKSSTEISIFLSLLVILNRFLFYYYFLLLILILSVLSYSVSVISYLFLYIFLYRLDFLFEVRVDWGASPSLPISFPTLGFTSANLVRNKCFIFFFPPRFTLSSSFLSLLLRKFATVNVCGSVWMLLLLQRKMTSCEV